eukprot:3079317-Alexandrium_andersonii.AAC.1
MRYHTPPFRLSDLPAPPRWLKCKWAQRRARLHSLTYTWSRSGGTLLCREHLNRLRSQCPEHPNTHPDLILKPGTQREVKHIRSGPHQLQVRHVFRHPRLRRPQPWGRA